MIFSATISIVVLFLICMNELKFSSYINVIIVNRIKITALSKRQCSYGCIVSYCLIIEVIKILVRLTKDPGPFFTHRTTLGGKKCIVYNDISKFISHIKQDKKGTTLIDIAYQSVGVGFQITNSHAKFGAYIVVSDQCNVVS